MNSNKGSNEKNDKKDKYQPKYTFKEYLELYKKLPYSYRQVLNHAILKIRLNDENFDKKIIYSFIKVRILQNHKSMHAFCRELSNHLSEQYINFNAKYYDHETYEAIRSTLKREKKIDGYYFEEIKKYLGITDNDIASLFSPEFAQDTNSAFFYNSLSKQSQLLIFQIALELLHLHEAPELYDDDEYDNDIGLPKKGTIHSTT